jgi:hypothetical protein
LDFGIYPLLIFEFKTCRLFRSTFADQQKPVAYPETL